MGNSWCGIFAAVGGYGVRGRGKKFPSTASPHRKLRPLRFNDKQLLYLMPILEFPKEDNSGRQALISLPDGGVLLRCDKPITVAIALYLLERAKARILLSLEDLDRVGYGS
jgi:hypothetical protein